MKSVAASGWRGMCGSAYVNVNVNVSSANSMKPVIYFNDTVMAIEMA